MRGDYCVTCEHWQPKPHEGWDPTKTYSTTYDVTMLRHYLATNNQSLGAWPGLCRLAPEWRATTAFHSCAHYTAGHDFTISWWEYCEIYDLRVKSETQRVEIKRLNASLKEARAKLRIKVAEESAA